MRIKAQFEINFPRRSNKIEKKPNLVSTIVRQVFLKIVTIGAVQLILLLIDKLM